MKRSDLELAPEDDRRCRSGLYRPPKRVGGRGAGRRSGSSTRRSCGSRETPTDGTRMVAALSSRALGRQVSRKRAQRVMREQRLLQRHRPTGRRRRPGYFRVERPDQLWHMDMTSVWVAEHGWCYLNAIVDCCTREIPAWSLELRCRSEEAVAVVDAGVARHAAEPGQLVLGTDNGTAYTSRGFRAHLKDLGIAHRRGGYRDPESQAFIESWFSKLKERCVWREEFETLDQARAVIGAYVERCRRRPHSSLNYRTPLEVRQTWEDGRALVKQAA